jgi:aminoglycoside 3-N-acetyltransferase
MNEGVKKPKGIPVTKKQIIADLRMIGLKRGDHVAVTLSLRSIGFVIGGPNTLIDAVLDVVGPEGTIMMNTFTKNFRASAIPKDYVFDRSTTIPYTGLVPTVIIKRKGAVRSRHPTCSVTAIGKLSEYLTMDHDEKANDLLPYKKLAEIGGKYLAIGLGNRLVAIRHEAQRRAGYFDSLPAACGVRYKNAEGETKLFIRNRLPCTRNLHKIVPRIEHESLIKRGKIGNAPSIFAPADKLIEALSTILKEKPELSLCDDCFCLYCRDLERRKNLYSKIQNPKIFQKSRLVRIMLRFRHKYVLKRDSSISLVNSSLKKPKSNSFVRVAKKLVASFIQKILEY